MTQFPSKLSFVSYLKYSPRGGSVASVNSRLVTYALKRDGFLEGRRLIDLLAGRIAAMLGEYEVLAQCFGPQVVLVPMPRSSPLLKGALWPTHRMCKCLQELGLGGEVLPCVERTKPVTRSSTARPGGRPGPEAHYESVEIKRLPILANPKRITLVDDVVTRGSTFVGVSTKVQEAFPEAQIECFAVVRTISTGEIEVIRDPVKGVITFQDGWLHREP